MGILNVTPDSFSDGGYFLRPSDALKHAENLIRDGADIIDIGGESSRPGSSPVTIAEELKRVTPVINLIKKNFPDTLISIDTYKSEVASEAINFGADLVNDITGLKGCDKMASLISKTKVPIVIMHMRGKPKNMQDNTHYTDLISEISFFFKSQVDLAKSYGIKDDKIILDPGIGFGKSLDQNFIILKNINKFCHLGYPILIGTSRKSFLTKTLKTNSNDVIEGTIASSLFCILNGASILRVHDVKKIKRSVEIIEKIMKS